MMREDSFDVFISKMKKVAEEYFGDNVKIQIQNKTKNNGSIYRGLMVQKSETSIAPVIYLNTLYEHYLDGFNYEELFEEFKNIYYSSDTSMQFDVSDFLCFENAKERIVFRLINYKENKKRLAQIPHRRILDFAIVYYFMAKEIADGRAAICIDNTHMKMWNVDEETLYLIAKKNSPYLLDVIITDIREIISRVSAWEFPESECDSFMYVATNKDGNYGATVMLYPGVLAGFAKRIDENFYIIPSSVHELIFLPQSFCINEEHLLEMIYEINHTELMCEDILSDNAYFYDMNKNEVEIISRSI